jgi:hypothetical protein
MSFVTIDWRPGERHLRRFGVASLFVFGALAGFTLWRQSLLGIALTPPTAAGVAGGLALLAAACGGLAWIAPGRLRLLYVGLMAASAPIGVVVAYLVMGLVFYGVVTPIAVIFRVIGRDALERELDPGAPTYWARRAPVADARRYYRQF